VEEVSERVPDSSHNCRTGRDLEEEPGARRATQSDGDGHCIAQL
jgi:hypothetical protein